MINILYLIELVSEFLLVSYMWIDTIANNGNDFELVEEMNFTQINRAIRCINFIQSITRNVESFI